MTEQGTQSSISTPLKYSGSNYYSERLVVRGNIIEVRPTLRHRLLMSIFAVIGLIIAIVPSFADEKIIWPIVAFGCFFFLIGSIALIGELRKPRPLLNLSLRQLFPKGMKHPNLAVSINTITHLEILGKLVNTPSRKGRSQNYTCYELNAVLQNDERHNILNHGNLKKMREDAHLLADILNLQIQEENLNPEASLPPTSPLGNSSFGRATSIFLFIFLFIFSLPFLAVGCYVLWNLCIKPLYKWNDSRHWTTTPAVIVHSSLAYVRPDAESQRIDIRYDYEVDGHSYRGTRYDFFRSDIYTNPTTSMEQAVADNPIGKHTQCLVNPACPEEAILSRTIPLSCIIWFFFPLPFIFFGLFIFICAIKTLFAPKNKPPLTP
ncbi:MAG: DUF3592 domain-containing protein [Victivallales bacterium]|nr:DUF3592 domain-containing protein [Victivallales bacterium]